MAAPCPENAPPRRTGTPAGGDPCLAVLLCSALLALGIIVPGVARTAGHEGFPNLSAGNACGDSGLGRSYGTGVPVRADPGRDRPFRVPRPP